VQRKRKRPRIPTHLHLPRKLAPHLPERRTQLVLPRPRERMKLVGYRALGRARVFLREPLERVSLIPGKPERLGLQLFDRACRLEPCAVDLGGDRLEQRDRREKRENGGMRLSRAVQEIGRLLVVSRHVRRIKVNQDQGAHRLIDGADVREFRNSSSLGSQRSLEIYDPCRGVLELGCMRDIRFLDTRQRLPNCPCQSQK
jgi:hypothetical protein